MCCPDQDLRLAGQETEQNGEIVAYLIRGLFHQNMLKMTYP